MADLDDLYQEVILDHNKSPRNFRAMADANRKAEGYGALLAVEVARLLREEAMLKRDPDYRAYAARVRYRLLPGLF